jgi:serine/threonine kinase 32
MAPEILLQDGYDSAVDWYSLGVVMYELVCGRRPFKAKNREDLVKLILTQDVRIPSLVDRKLSKEVICCIRGVWTRKG